MAITRETELGTIQIVNAIFAQIIFDGMMQEDCLDQIWPSTPRGRQVGIIELFTDTEFSMYIDVKRGEDGRIVLEFSVIVRFGVSIRAVTRALADYVAEQIRALDGAYPSVITINIAGVRSRHKVRRNTKVVYRYEAD